MLYKYHCHNSSNISSIDENEKIIFVSILKPPLGATSTMAEAEGEPEDALPACWTTVLPPTYPPAPVVVTLTLRLFVWVCICEVTVAPWLPEFIAPSDVASPWVFVYVVVPQTQTFMVHLTVLVVVCPRISTVVVVNCETPSLVFDWEGGTGTLFVLVVGFTLLLCSSVKSLDLLPLDVKPLDVSFK